MGINWTGTEASGELSRTSQCRPSQLSHTAVPRDIYEGNGGDFKCTIVNIPRVLNLPGYGGWENAAVVVACGKARYVYVYVSRTGSMHELFRNSEKAIRIWSLRIVA